MPEFLTINVPYLEESFIRTLEVNLDDLFSIGSKDSIASTMISACIRETPLSLHITSHPASIKKKSQKNRYCSQDDTKQQTMS